VVEAQLRLLQAQMEPHFLFNTLANVLTLIEVEPQRARQMLESFTDYLRASLGKMRQDETSLGSELDLAEAYLRLLQLRMEDRLRFKIDVDADTLAIRARTDAGVLQLTVSDDGLGPDAPRRRSTGNGIALDNLRQRLQALYGDAASLTIEPLQPGTRATLRLPLTLPSPAAIGAAATPCPSP
jgi:sensor histidine kinase YesM